MQKWELELFGAFQAPLPETLVFLCMVWFSGILDVRVLLYFLKCMAQTVCLSRNHFHHIVSSWVTAMHTQGHIPV